MILVALYIFRDPGLCSVFQEDGEEGTAASASDRAGGSHLPPHGGRLEDQGSPGAPGGQVRERG
jgi:hypothetical protein